MLIFDLSTKLRKQVISSDNFIWSLSTFSFSSFCCLDYANICLSWVDCSLIFFIITGIFFMSWLIWFYYFNSFIYFWCIRTCFILWKFVYIRYTSCALIVYVKNRLIHIVCIYNPVYVLIATKSSLVFYLKIFYAYFFSSAVLLQGSMLGISSHNFDPLVEKLTSYRFSKSDVLISKSSMRFHFVVIIVLPDE